jgi:hypothetical protein
MKIWKIVISAFAAAILGLSVYGWAKGPSPDPPMSPEEITTELAKQHHIAALQDTIEYLQSELDEIDPQQEPDPEPPDNGWDL